MTPYGSKPTEGDTRQKDQDWAINYISPDTARLAVQMDMRDEIKQLNLEMRDTNRRLDEILETMKDAIFSRLPLPERKTRKRRKRKVTKQKVNRSKRHGK